MGVRGSSSKRKEKLDKISSKKKSRKRESTKRHRYDSDSSSSDDDSLHLKRSSKSDHKRTKHKKPRRDSSLPDYSESPSSDSDSSPNDDNEYKGRKARRSMIHVKDVKKKVRKRSISSVDDVERTSGRKRKISSRDDDIRPKKKSSKKKSRKDLSSSDSESCSTCQSGSSGSEANDNRKRNRISSGKKKVGRRGRGTDKGRHKNKDRSPSSTSAKSSSPGPSVGKYDDDFYPVNNARRLKSVITIVHQQDNEDENILEKDPHKEEIVYDQNDYPSPKSIDSNEGGSKMESDNQLNAASSEELRGLEKSRIDEGDHNNEERKINKSVPVAALGGEDLEAILRQKALENFMKFRKSPLTFRKSNTMKINNETNVASFSNSTVDTLQNKSIEQGSFNAQEMDQGSGLLSQREIPEAVKLLDNEPVEKSSQPGLAELNDAALLQEEDKIVNLVKDVSESNTSSIVEDAKACSSKGEETSAEPSTGEQSSDQRNKAKDSSQFEQKTMTVMRGGELVQVSYKVYIPKKAPALARRQFKR